MTERRIEHVYDCSEELFWDQIFLDETYNRSLYLDELHFDEYRVLKTEERGGEIHRVVQAVPPVGELPGPLKKLAAGGLGYQERGVVDKKARRYRLRVTPRSLSGKLTITGELYTTGLPDGKCRRTYLANVEARVFGLAGMIEKRILDDVETSYDKAATFTNRWIAEHHR